MASSVEIFGTLGVVASQSMNLLSIPSIRKILLAKSTMSFATFPIMIALTNAIHNIVYAIVSWNRFVIISSSITFTFNFCFLCIHYRYSIARGKILSEFITYPILSILIAGIGARHYSGACFPGDWECVQTSRVWLGLVSTIISCLCYCGQLSTFRTIVKTKNASSISPWMTAGVAFRAVVWNTYSWLVGDWFNCTSSSVGILSAVTQIVLLTKYSSKKLKA